jgi:predicted transcriptional regulator
LLQQIEEKGQDHPVADCMHAGVPVYASDDALESVYRRMQRGNEQLVLVRDRGALTGYVDLDNVAEYLLFRKAMLKRNRFEIHP